MKNIVLIVVLYLVAVTTYGQTCVGEPGRVKWEMWRGLFADNFSELTALEYFPKRPDITQTIYSLNAPNNFDENFGAKISGFIKVPVSDSVSFNITGNSKVEFYLSPTQQPAQMVLRASISSSTNEYEHTKFTSQTTQKFWLVQGQYYYFEIRYVESTSTDHCKLFWKNSFVSPINWNIITAAYINDVGCKPATCPARGTPCNDNNPNTTQDQADGHCNCIGKPVNPDNCIGARNSVKRYRFDNRVGSTLTDLYSDPNFPAMAATSMQLPIVGIKSETLVNSGNLIQGYLTVPVSGNYKFNVTGDDQTKIFISSDSNPANKNTNTATVTAWTNTTEHSKYVTQSTGNIFLNAGQFYYIELNHKQGTGGSHFGMFWQTPFTEPNVWKRIPSFYLYDYSCTLACVTQGTLCDDGNPFTNNDAFDNDCNCVGTPCSGPDCNSPLANYIPYEKCGLTDQLDNNPSNNWLSCQVSSHPIPALALPASHWIKYDLGARHQLLTSQIWNYNVQGQTANGFQNVRIDYSENNTTWTHLGTYNWPLATGDSGYGGFIGPDFGSIHARYIVVTSLDGVATCRGLGKVAFKAVFCPVSGTACDDNNHLTINDIFDGACECKGQSIVDNECDVPTLTLGNVTLNTEVYSAINYVTSISQINTEHTVGMVAGKAIELNPGFKTTGDVVFVATIEPCNANRPELPIRKVNDIAKINKETESLTIVPVEGTDLVDIHYVITKPGMINLHVVDKNQKYSLVNYEHLNQGHFVKRLRTKKLTDASPLVTLITTENSLRDRLKPVSKE